MQTLKINMKKKEIIFLKNKHSHRNIKNHYTDKVKKKRGLAKQQKQNKQKTLPSHTSKTHRKKKINKQLVTVAKHFLDLSKQNQLA